MKLNSMVKWLLILASFSWLSACVNMPQEDLTPLALQSIQTKSYPVSKQRLFYAAMISVEGLGYDVKMANLEGGTFSAESIDRMPYRQFIRSSLSIFVTETGASSANIRISLIQAGRQVTLPQPYLQIFDIISHNLFTEQVINV